MALDDARNSVVDPQVSTVAPGDRRAGSAGAFNASAAAIKAFGSTAGELRKGQLASDLNEQTEEVIRAASTLQRDANAELGGVDANGVAIDTTNLPGAEEVDNLKEKFAVLGRARDQGRISDSALAIEAQATLKQITNKAPGFAQEFRKVAADLIGFDPTGSATQALVDTLNPDPVTRTQSLRAKRLEKATLQSETTGIPVEAILRDMDLADIQTNKDVVNAARVKLGDLTIAALTTDAVEDAALQGRTVINTILQNMVEQGGTADPEGEAILLEEARRATNLKYRQIAQDAPGGQSVNNGQMASMKAAIDEQFDSIEKSLQNSDLRQIIMKRRDAMVAISQTLGRRAFPTLSAINDSFGQAGVNFYITMMDQTNGDPKVLQAQYGTNPAAQDLLKLQSMAPLISDAYGMILGEQPRPETNTKDMKDALSLAASAMTNLRTHGDADIFNAGLEEIQENRQPVKSITTVANQRGAYKILDKENKAGIIRDAKGQTESLSTELISEIQNSGTLVNWDPVDGFVLMNRDNTPLRVNIPEGSDADPLGQNQRDARVENFTRASEQRRSQEIIDQLNTQVVKLARTHPQYLDDIGTNEVEWVSSMLSKINGSAVIGEIAAQQETNPIDVKVLQEAAKSKDIGPLLDAAEAAGIADFSALRDNLNTVRPQFFLDPETGAVVQQ